MPEQRTLERARQDRRQGKAASTQAGEFVREEMEHIRSGKHGARSTKQAIAIGLSKARRAGVPLPPPKKGATSEKTRRSAEHAYEAGRQGRRPSPKRSRATPCSPSSTRRSARRSRAVMRACGASGTARHLTRRWPGRPGKPHANDRLAHDQGPPSAQPVRGDQSEHGNGSPDFTPWSRLQPPRARRRAAAALEGTRTRYRCAGSCRGVPEPSRFAATRGRSPAPGLR